MEGHSLVPSDSWSEKRQYHNYQQHQPPQQQYQQEAQHWMTPEISAQVQACNQLRKTAEATGKQEDHEAYQAQCRKVHGMIEESKINLGLGQLPALPQGYGYGWHQHNGYGYNNYYPRGPRENSNFQHPMGNQYQKKQFTCKPCNRSYFSQRKLDEHIQEHVECPFPECKMSAHAKIIDQHINNQHMLVNFAQLQIDDETWVAERKKRFPSAQRAELRRAEQMEKLKRGESLGISKKPFKSKIKSIVSNNDGSEETSRCNTNNKKETNAKISNADNEKEHVNDPEGSKAENNSNGIVGEQEKRENREFKGKRDRKERLKRKRQHNSLIDLPPVSVVEVDLLESDSEQRDGLCAFKGTKSFYEEIGEVSYFGNNNIDESEEDNDQEEKIAISDDEEWEVEKQTESSGGQLLLGGALGSLMGAYSDSEEENVDEAPKQEKDKTESVPKLCPENALQKVTVDAPHDGKEEDSQQNSESVPRTRTRKRMPRKVKGPVKGPPKPRKAPRRRKTLLERLLQADIIHERNVILQCIRFIVRTNFLSEDKSKDVQEECENKVEINSKCVVDCSEKLEDKPAGKDNLKVSQDWKQQYRQDNNLQDEVTQDGRQQDRQESWRSKRILNNKDMQDEITQDGRQQDRQVNDNLQDEATQDRRQQGRQESWRSKRILNNTDMQDEVAQDGRQQDRQVNDNLQDEATQGRQECWRSNSILNNKDMRNKKAAKRLKKELLAGDDNKKDVEKDDNKEREVADCAIENCHVKKQELNGDTSNTVLEKKIGNSTTSEEESSDRDDAIIVNSSGCREEYKENEEDCNVEKVGSLEKKDKSGISEEIPHSGALKRKESENNNSEKCEKQIDEVIVKRIKLNNTEDTEELSKVEEKHQ